MPGRRSSSPPLGDAASPRRAPEPPPRSRRQIAKYAIFIGSDPEVQSRLSESELAYAQGYLELYKARRPFPPSATVRPPPHPSLSCSISQA